MQNAHIKKIVSDYYAEKIRTHGTTAKGVDWKDEASQNLRLSVLQKLFAHDPEASVIDLGCGYGAFLPFIRGTGHRGDFIGVDICDDMLTAARKNHRADPRARFVSSLGDDEKADYVVSSGIFNTREAISDDDWWNYIVETIEWKDKHAVKGFAFNCLTSYSDADKMVSRLYYANSLKLFDLCKTKYAKNVALLHDYGLYEFTLIVRKVL